MTEMVSLEKPRRGCLGTVAAILGAVASVVFILNLTAGIIEIPDNLPFIGNLDEAAAAALLLACLRYLGLDVLAFMRRGPRKTNVRDARDERKKDC